MRRLPSPRSSRLPSNALPLGRVGFARVSAVDGSALTLEMPATLERFDREGISADARRRRLVARFTPSGR
ncbi:hypothetical protein J2847_006757 [Azospirillum agricola]|uniref:hypothetical protein n=1 Tax=Azospirillum agricola TaxID=1720247 RepID=UPI001AEB8638|nr:hypothetical protein [Azospirillum agricola]MBP2233419.1 hypothetical protein [Azospirillum agricola]